MWGAVYSLGNSLGHFGVPMGPHWLRAQLDITHFWYWKFHLVAREVQLGLYIPIPWQFCLYCLHIYIYDSTILFFYTTPQNTPLFQSSLPVLPPSTPSPLPLLTRPSCSSPRPIYNHLFYFPFLGRSLYSPVSFSMPAFCDSLDCSLVIIDLTAHIHI